MIDWIEKWYSDRCNGDWEHSYGITIKTLDNPGWDIIIELTDTGIELIDEDWTYKKNDENDWYGYKITDNIFYGSGDPYKLNFLIKLFKEKVEG